MTNRNAQLIFQQQQQLKIEQLESNLADARETSKKLAEAVKFLMGECDGKLWAQSEDAWCPVPAAMNLIKEKGLL